jgi:hypothetical protein
MILFLDFDGVLHPAPSPECFDRGCMSHLEAVLQEYPQLDIVITSSWRELKSIEELKGFLGSVIGSRVISTTPVIDDPFIKFVRYYEVQEYLRFNDLFHTPWIALDDEIGNYPENSPVIFTNYRTGLTMEDAIKLRAMINVQITLS